MSQQSRSDTRYSASKIISGAVVKILQVVIVTVVIEHVVELQAVTSHNVTRSQNVLVTLQHVQLQVTTCTMTFGKKPAKISISTWLKAHSCA